jgi:hypothetical protein
MTQQPEALRLAKELDAYHTAAHHKQAVAELRRLHEANQAMLGVLKLIVETDVIDVVLDLQRAVRVVQEAIAKEEQA